MHAVFVITHVYAPQPKPRSWNINCCLFIRECDSNFMNNNLSSKQPINNLDGI